MVKIAAALPAAPQILAKFAATDADLQDIDGPDLYQVIKSHEVNEAGTALLNTRASTIMLSVRDPRDGVTSLMLYQNHSFPGALTAIDRVARYCQRFADDKRAHLLRYETGFTEDPATIDHIADSFGRPLSPPDRERIIAETRRSSIESEISRLSERPTAVRDNKSGDVIDSVTHWHSHHANRTGEIGRWRWMLTPSQVAEIEWRMRDWMDAFGYERGGS